MVFAFPESCRTAVTSSSSPPLITPDCCCCAATAILPRNVSHMNQVWDLRNATLDPAMRSLCLNIASFGAEITPIGCCGTKKGASIVAERSTWRRLFDLGPSLLRLGVSRQIMFLDGAAKDVLAWPQRVHELHSELQSEEFGTLCKIRK